MAVIPGGYRDDPAWKKAYAEYIEPGVPGAAQSLLARMSAVEGMYAIEARYENANRTAD